MRAHFRILVDQRVIVAALGTRLEGMVGFRNIAVHEYDRIDRAILKAIVGGHLTDLEGFSQAIKALLG